MQHLRDVRRRPPDSCPGNPGGIGGSRGPVRLSAWLARDLHLHIHIHLHRKPDRSLRSPSEAAMFPPLPDRIVGRGTL